MLRLVSGQQRRVTGIRIRKISRSHESRKTALLQLKLNAKAFSAAHFVSRWFDYFILVNENIFLLTHRCVALRWIQCVIISLNKQSKEFQWRLCYLWTRSTQSKFTLPSQRCNVRVHVYIGWTGSHTYCTRTYLFTNCWKTLIMDSRNNQRRDYKIIEKCVVGITSSGIEKEFNVV